MGPLNNIGVLGVVHKMTEEPPPLPRFLRRIFPSWLSLVPTVLLGPLVLYGLLALGIGVNTPLGRAAAQFDPSGGYLWPFLFILPWPLFIGGIVSSRLLIRRSGLWLGLLALNWLGVVVTYLAFTQATGVSLIMIIIAFQVVCYISYIIYWEY